MMIHPIDTLMFGEQWTDWVTQCCNIFFANKIQKKNWRHSSEIVAWPEARNPCNFTGKELNVYFVNGLQGPSEKFLLLCLSTVDWQSRQFWGHFEMNRTPEWFGEVWSENFERKICKRTKIYKDRKEFCGFLPFFGVYAPLVRNWIELQVHSFFSSQKCSDNYLKSELSQSVLHSIN